VALLQTSQLQIQDRLGNLPNGTALAADPSWRTQNLRQAARQFDQQKATHRVHGRELLHQLGLNQDQDLADQQTNSHSTVKPTLLSDGLWSHQRNTASPRHHARALD
jgi:hypothetical protein